MSEGKKNIIGMLLEEYDIKSAKDIEDALKDLLGGTIQEMLESEMDEHLGYQEYERSDNPDYRNGKKTKKIRGNFGETEIEVPQDRDGSFEPKVVKKRQKDISGIEQKIISLYAKGMTTRQISETIEDIYGFEVSDGMVSDITDRLLPQIDDWQKRPLDEVYPVVFIDAVHFSEIPVPDFLGNVNKNHRRHHHDPRRQFRSRSPAENRSRSGCCCSCCAAQARCA